MNSRESPGAGDSTHEIARLVATLRDTEHRLEELTAGEVDSVMDPDGRMFLLQRAQEQLHHSDAARQAAILNALPAHVALLDVEGLIISVNEGWRGFADANALQAPGHAVGLNYLEICDPARGDDSAEAPQAAAGIRSVLDGTSRSFSLEYPCHSPVEQRWFLMTVTPLAEDHPSGAVVMHLNITERKRTEIALGVAELKYRSMFENSSEGIFQTSPEGHFVSGNLALARILGYASPEELIHERADLERQGYVDPAMREKFKRLIEEQGFVRNFEYESRRKDGTRIWLSENTRLVRDAAGCLICYEGSLQDITARKQAEQALQASERKQRELALQLVGEKERLVEAQAVAKVGSWETDLATLKVTWSEETYRIFETDPQTFQSTHQGFLQLVHPDDRAAVDKAFLGSFGQRSPCVMEHRLLLPNGRIKIVEERWQTFVDETGKPVRALGTTHDITERRHALQAVTDSEARLSALLEHSSDVIAISGLDGRLLYVSQSIKRVAGYEPDELVGTSLMNLVHPDDQTRVVVAFKELIRQPVVQRTERRYRRKDGTWMDSEAIAVNLAHIPGVGGIVTTLRDITERKRAERQLQASAADLKETQRLARLGSWQLQFSNGALRWSDETFALFGRDPGQGAPRYDELANLLTPESFAVMDAAVHKTRQQGVSFEIDLEVVRTDQSRRWIHAHGEPVKDATGVIGLLHGTALDITERVAAEAILRKHASELERFHRLSVGRELQMIELKKQVNELTERLGKKAPYDLAFLRPDAGAIGAGNEKAS